MNKKRIGIILAAAVVIIIGALFLLKDRTCSPRTPAPQSTALMPAEAPSMLDGISADVLAAGEITPANFKPLSDWLQSRYTSLKATALWKKFQPDQLLRSELEKAFKKSRANSGVQNAEKDLSELYALLAGLGAFVDDFSDGVFVAVPQSFAVGGTLDLPKAMLKLVFSKGDAPAHVRRILEKEVLGGSSESAGDFVTIKKEGEAFLITVTPEQATPIPARLTVKERELSLILGAADESPFKVKAGEQPLTQSAQWRQLARARGAAAAMTVYVEPPKITAFVKRSIEARGGDSQAFDQLFAKSWNDIQALLFSSDFKGGLHSTQCALATAGSEYARMVAAFTKARAAVTPAQGFERLINSNTIAAGRMQYFMSLFGSLPQAAGTEKFAQAFKAIADYLGKTGLKEAALVLNVSPGMPIPDGGVLLGEASLKGDALLAETERLLTSLLGGSAAAAPARSTGSTGRALLSLPGGPGGMPIVGAVVNDSSLVFGLNELFIDQSEQALKSGQSGFTMFDSASIARVGDVSSADFYLYLNTEQAFALVRGYLPMALAMMAQGSAQPPPEIGEVNEIIDFLSGAAISVQRTSAMSDEVVCSEKLLTTLTLKARPVP